MGVYLPACCPFRFKGAWSEEFKLYSIGRETVPSGIVCRHACKEDPRLRTPTSLSPGPEMTGHSCYPNGLDLGSSSQGESLQNGCR